MGLVTVESLVSPGSTTLRGSFAREEMPLAATLSLLLPLEETLLLPPPPRLTANPDTLSKCSEEWSLSGLSRAESGK